MSSALCGSHPAFLVVITSAPGSVPGIYVMMSVVKEELLNLPLWPNISLNSKAFTFRYMPFTFTPLSKALTQQTIGDPGFKSDYQKASLLYSVPERQRFWF